MVTFQGINSVADRILFTRRGPIVKRALPVLTGANLQIVNETDVDINTGNFTSTHDGYVIEVTGSPSGRNDGEFTIEEVLGSTRLRLKNVNFDVSDVSQTTQDVIELANQIKTLYELHRTQKIDEDGDGVEEGVHGTDDTVNIVVAPDAFDLTSAITLLNDLSLKFSSHVTDVSGSPQVHKDTDSKNVIDAPDANNLPSALNLVNDLRRKYESHRQSRVVHQVDDSVNRATVSFVKVTKGIYPGSLTGPFTWTLKNPRLGEVADDPTDVSVRVNGLDVTVDAVFGLLGAVVLQTKPGSLDSVEVDYDYLNNPPSRFLRLNSPEFNLNQYGNLGHAGLPSHRYRSRSYLIDPSNSPDFVSAVQPKSVGWKYKGLERAYTAVLNDPSTLLLNVPTNKIAYPVLFEQVQEKTINYDPTSLPNNSTDPWVLSGDGTFSLVSGGNQLTIVDSNVQTGPDSNPPFFYHDLDLRSPSYISAAFRASVLDDSSLETDGVWTGVSFGFSDGDRAVVVSFLVTEATNLSSAIVMANDVKSKYDAHLSNLGSHSPDDTSEITNIVDASDLTSLVILVNTLKSRYSSHAAKGSGPGSVHSNADVVNVVTSPDATDLESSITLVNELRTVFNLHRVQGSVHFVSDTINEVTEVKQIGILTNRGSLEFSSSWESFASDWTELKTYRFFFDNESNIDLFISGDTTPSVSVGMLDLPSLSSIDAQFDPAQQTFFGALGRDSTSTSNWQFIRVNVTPVDGNLIENNKVVDYDGSVVPELDTATPWITVGQGGIERVISPDVLLLDSTSSTPPQDITSSGLTSGNYKGFLRLEPILSRDTALSLEFKASIDYYTQSLDNKAAAVVMDDENFTVQFAFLQFDPTPATVTGTATEPLTIVLNDDLRLSIQNGSIITVVFQTGDTTAALAATRINSAVGFSIADVSGGKVRLTSAELGATATFEILDGSAVSKLGFSPGPYFGKDSNPEPKISWFGSDFPDRDDPVWTRGGTQNTTMLGRTMRISDTSISDYSVFNLTESRVTNQAFNPVVDWKLDFRLKVLSFVAGDSVPAVGPYSSLSFAGSLVSVDEGIGGKNIELHFAVNGSGDQFLNLLSYNNTTGALDVISQYAFSWNDGVTHSFNIYTSKITNTILVLADGQLLTPFVGPAPTYTGLNPGVIGPSIAFGSGAEPVVGSDMRASKSVVDWESVAVFRDGKISNPDAGSKRYIGIYTGGDVALLSSYSLYQVDWTVLHTYRIIRNPVTSVSVYIDGGATPVISVPYDNLSIPPASSSFLKGITNSHSSVAFGSFNPKEIVRTRWDFFRYSIGKITLTDRLVPPHQVLNQHNAVASPDHLKTQVPHTHDGFSVYSGGTPLDTFMANEDVQSHTTLGEGTPPVPMTQNLESRKGLIKVATPTDGLLATDLLNTNGFMSDLEDDTTNVVDSVGSITQVIDLANDLRTQYEAHRQSTVFHIISDGTNVVTAPVSTSLATALTLLNDIKTQFNSHRVSVGVHSVNDVTNVITAVNAVDISTAVDLANDIKTQYEAHRPDITYHLAADTTNVVTISSITDVLTNLISMVNLFREKYLLHTVQSRVHLADDTENVILPESAVDLSSALDLSNAEKEQFNQHISATLNEAQKVHTVDDGVNIITSVDATDLDSLASLAEELTTKYEAHRVEPGVHGSTVFIRLDPPSRVLYEGMKFWTFEEGEEGHVYPFSDDETLHMDGFGYKNDQTLSYDGSVLPENQVILDVQNLANDLRAKYEAHRVEAGVHPVDDVVNTMVAPVATDLSTSIVLLLDLKSKLNSHVVEPTVHIQNDQRNQSFAVDPTEIKTAISLVNEIKLKYERHRHSTTAHTIEDSVNFITVTDAPPVADPGWQLFNEGTGVPDISLQVDGPDEFLRYGTVGVNPLSSVYKKETGLTDHPSFNFDFSVTMRVNAFSYSPDVDTSIYAGFLSSMGPGVAAAVGYDAIANIPYVKIQDVNSDETMFRVPFNWADGQFHTFKITRDVKTDTFNLVFVS